MPNTKQMLPPIATWGKKFSKEVLDRKRRDGPREFAQGFSLQAIHDGELKFPSFKTCYQPDMVLSSIVQRRLPTYIGVDLSSATRPGNAIVALSLDPVTQRRIPVEAVYGAWTSPETAGKITDVWARHAVEYIMVENNAYQGAIIEWVQEDAARFPWWTKVEAYTTGKGKADPNYGLPGLENEFHNKAWAVASGEWAGHEHSCKCGWCEWRRQILMYPRGMATDFVMATWFALTAVNRWPRMAGGGISLSGMNYR